MGRLYRAAGPAATGNFSLEIALEIGFRRCYDGPAFAPEGEVAPFSQV
jgi:hypothetical protein